MNLEFYKLRRQPFGSPLIRILVFWRFTSAGVLRAFVRSAGAPRLFGIDRKAGHGKKRSLIFKLLELLKDSARRISFSDSWRFSRSLFLLLQDLEAEPAGEDWPSMQKSLNAALMRNRLRNRQVVVVIDEAQNLTDDAFESLRSCLISRSQTTSCCTSSWRDSRHSRRSSTVPDLVHCASGYPL